MIPSISSLVALFDRRRSSHRWFGAFADLETRGGTNALVCRSWRMDHRVTENREEDLLQAPEYSTDPTGEDWCGQRYAYFDRAVRRPTFPGAWGPCSAYLEPPNRTNAIDLRTLPGHEELVHVASLNRILDRLASGEHETGGMRLRFQELTGHTLPLRTRASGAFGPALFPPQVDAIAEEAVRRGPATVRHLARLFCDTLGEFQPPWWACFAAEIASLITTSDATGLCRSLGMGHLGAGEWLLVWRYDLALLGRLYPGVPLFRPTVVEANDSPCHYPSPPNYRYGITMPLAPTGVGALREVLHPPLFGAAAGEACTGNLLRIATPPLAGHNELPGIRRAHRHRLVVDFGGPDTRGWLDRHPELS